MGGGLSSFLYFLIRLLGFGEIYGSRFSLPKNTTAVHAFGHKPVNKTEEEKQTTTTPHYFNSCFSEDHDT